MAALGCSACSITGPIALIADNGQILRGSFKASTSGGSLSVTDGTLTCSGNYDPGAAVRDPDGHRMVNIPVLCSDGRFGVATAVQIQLGTGGGTFKLNDGAHGLFAWGKARLPCPFVGSKLGAAAEAACTRDVARAQAEAQSAARQHAASAAILAEGLGAVAAGTSSMANSYAVAQPVYTPPQLYNPSPIAIPTPDLSSQYLPKPAPPPTQWVPYTPGGGNPGGYGLLAH